MSICIRAPTAVFAALLCLARPMDPQLWDTPRSGFLRTKQRNKRKSKMEIKNALIIVAGLFMLATSACTDNQAVNAATGAAVGGALGNQVGSGKGKTAATIAGAAGGAAIGANAR